MKTIQLQVPDNLPFLLDKGEENWAKELLLAAVVKWYELGLISQGKAAEIAGLSRAEFINELARFQVSPFQVTPEELEKELENAK